MAFGPGILYSAASTIVFAGGIILAKYLLRELSALTVMTAKMAIGSAMLIGYVAATAEAQLQSLTVGSLTGRLGLASAPVEGELLLHLAFYAARGLAELGHHQRHHCQSSRPDCVAAVAGLDREARRVAWLANLTGRKQEVVLDWGEPLTSVLLLDEQSLREGGAEQWREWTGALPIQLLPYSLACLR